MHCFLCVLDLIRVVYLKVEVPTRLQSTHPTKSAYSRQNKAVIKCTQEYFDDSQDSGQMIVKENKMVF